MGYNEAVDNTAIDISTIVVILCDKSGLSYVLTGLYAGGRFPLTENIVPSIKGCS